MLRQILKYLTSQYEYLTSQSLTSRLAIILKGKVDNNKNSHEAVPSYINFN